MATETGPKVLDAIRYNRSLMEQISLLLQTADKMLGEESWICLHSNTCLIESSASLLNPKSWIPKDAFRFYMRDWELSRTLAFVSVLLDDAGQAYEHFDEPLITAGCFVYSEEIFNEVMSERGYEYAWCRSFGQASEYHDGSIAIKDNEEHSASGDDKIALWLRRATFGRPLVEISNADDLKSMIITPLMNLIAGQETEVENLYTGNDAQNDGLNLISLLTGFRNG